MRLLLASVSVVLASCVGGVSPPAPQQTALPVIATVAVDLTRTGRAIPSDFDGFSIEVNDAAQKYLGPPQAPNTVFEQLLRNLGEATIRIGGDSTDFSCWNPPAAPHPAGCQYKITPDAVKGFLEASARTRWDIIAGVNLAQNSASWAIAYGRDVAETAAAVSGSRLIGFELGNEPDLYSTQWLFDHHPVRPEGFTWSDLVRDWRPYVTRFNRDRLTSRYLLVGPAYDDASDVWRDRYLLPFARGVGPQHLGVLTVHEYPTYTCGGNTVTIAELLASSLVKDYVAQAQGWVAVARRLQLPLELGETNSTACGGQNGVDNVFAATAWGLDWLFVNAQLGMRRVNFHMDDAYYSAVRVTKSLRDGKDVYRDAVEPLYYAMYAFSSLAQGNVMLPATISTRANITAYAVRLGRSQAVRVFIINKSLHSGGVVAVRPSERTARAVLLLIDAPALDSNAVAFGGVAFNDGTGLLRGPPETVTLQPDSSGAFRFMLSNASIAVLTVPR